MSSPTNRTILNLIGTDPANSTDELPMKPKRVTQRMKIKLIPEPMKTTLATLLVGAMALSSHAGEHHSKSSKTIVETAVSAGSFKTLATALGAADLVDVLNGKGPFTVFAPTDVAFAKLPHGTVESLLKPENREKLQAILKYHVISGRVALSDALRAGKAGTVLGDAVSIGFSEGKVRVNDATLRTADLDASNGLIHVIDSVLLPPAPKNDIAAVAKRTGQFKTLLAAVGAAGLKEVLTGKSPVTVLAPTDAAFEALPKGMVESLLKPENKSKLQSILTLHVVKGLVSAGDALNAGAAKSVSGGALKFGIADGTFEVNGATIVKTDIKCDNGIIHVIDAVLLPAEKVSSHMGAAKRIEAAVMKGVSVFNHGDHAKCADIYSDCMQALVADGGVCSSTRETLTKILTTAKQTHCDTTRAWMLRRGLDHAYQIVSR